jgi:hypothetical protein
MLHSDLQKFLYNITEKHKLADHDKEHRLHSATRGRLEVGTLRTWFSDELSFSMNGVVNKQNA